MTERLYYNQPDLLEFDSVVEEALLPEPAQANPQNTNAQNTIAQDKGSADQSPSQSRPAIILRETAFYPTSGGQVHDTGWIALASERLRISEVSETEDGRIVHYLEAPVRAPVGQGLKPLIAPGTAIHGTIDAVRRRDHMQQHTGQHVLSAAFIELYQFPTVSFHMGEDYCSIDLATESLVPSQVITAEKRANEIVFENRPVTIRYVRREEAEKLGLRKLPPAERDELRLIEIADFDLSACGGTHVNATGQIGSILLRKVEKTRQGMRVEFVCGARAVRIARRDYATLTEAAALYSAQLADVPEMIRKSLEESKALRRRQEQSLEELATAMAQSALAQCGAGALAREGTTTESPVQSETDKAAEGAATSRRVIVRTFPDRDTAFARLFAQAIARSGFSAIALVASTMHPSGIVFAQSPGGPADMGALLKQILSSVGGRGGGSRDFAQGGFPAGCDPDQLLRDAERKILS